MKRTHRKTPKARAQGLLYRNTPTRIYSLIDAMRPVVVELAFYGKA